MRFNQRAGFTLLEGIVYIGLLSMISSIIVALLFSEIRTWGYAREERNAVDVGRIIVDRLTQEIRLAKSVSSTGSVFDANPGSLLLNTYDTVSSSAETTLTIDISGNDLRLYREFESPASIVGSRARIQSLIFRHLSTSSGEAVRFEFIVSSGAGRYETSKSFTGLATLRGNY